MTRCVLGTLYGAFRESSLRVYEYSKLRVNRKSMKCLRSVKIFCSHFDASTSFTLDWRNSGNSSGTTCELCFWFKCGCTASSSLTSTQDWYSGIRPRTMRVRVHRYISLLLKLCLNLKRVYFFLIHLTVPFLLNRICQRILPERVLYWRETCAAKWGTSTTCPGSISTGRDGSLLDYNSRRLGFTCFFGFLGGSEGGGIVSQTNFSLSCWSEGCTIPIACVPATVNRRLPIPWPRPFNRLTCTRIG